MPDALQTALAESIEETLETVEVVGGRRLPEPCLGEDLGAVLDRPHSPERDHTTHCDQPARFVLPYQREDGGRGELTACAIDDLASAWPALASATEGWL